MGEGEREWKRSGENHPNKKSRRYSGRAQRGTLSPSPARRRALTLPASPSPFPSGVATLSHGRSMEARVYEGPVRLQPSCGSNATSRLGPRRGVVAIGLGGCRIIVARRTMPPRRSAAFTFSRGTRASIAATAT